jgi:NodT family efflux transporter outer membrane factor (OMF) lipoprotein
MTSHPQKTRPEPTATRPAWPRARAGLLIALACCLALTGCTVGPDFKQPAPPEANSYGAPADLAGPGPTTTAAQQITAGGVQPAWWHHLGSAELDRLTHQALMASPTLAAAEATLRQAQELYAARAGASRLPQLDGTVAGQRQRTSPSALGQTGEAREFSLYSAGLGVRYTFDLFGGNRRALEALAARSEYRQHQVAAARLTLAASIASTAITQAQLADQVETMAAILTARQGQLTLVQEQVRLGQAAPHEELALQTQVEQSRAELPLLRAALQHSRHLLAVLAGLPPGTEGLPFFRLTDFTLPAELPLLVPSELVRARPDILASEALLEAANADYGVAVARLYPQINLSAELGSQALTTGALFGSASSVWALVGQLTQPLFNPGLPAEKRAALAAFEAAGATYQAVVLEALQSVADLLASVDNEAERQAALTAADQAAQAALRTTGQRYSLGAAAYDELLLAQQQANQTSLDLISARASRLTTTIAFYQAMGGSMPP